jgi:hypothetical protein
MSFCPKCNYVLDITKNIPKDKLSMDELKLLNISKFISTVLAKDDSSLINENIVLDFDLSNLKASNLYKKLNKDDKNKVTDSFKNIKDETTTDGAYYICNNCGYFKSIRQGELLFSKNYSKANVFESVDYELKCSDNTLPRTKDYICKNKNCITHDKKNYKLKEAVWFRQTESYQLTYVCCVCKTGWLI